MTKIEEVFYRNNMAGDDDFCYYECDSMHWKTKMDKELRMKHNQNQDPQCLCDTIRNISAQYVSKEVQEVVIGVLLMIGLWTLTKWMLSLVFSLMWPLLLITGFVLAIPTWRSYITDEYLPDNFNFMDTVTRKLSVNTMAFQTPTRTG